MGLQLSLRYRIISLVALFAVLLIAAFTILLVTRQLHVITENNQFRARIGTFAAKGSFERTLLSNVRTTGGDAEKAFQKLIPILMEGQLSEEVDVADPKGKVIASSNEYAVGSSLMEEEKLWATEAMKNYSSQNWFFPQVTPKELVMYTPISLDDSPRYVAVLRYSLGNMAEAIRQVMQMCLLTALAVTVVVVPLALLLIQAILGPIQMLNRATKDISAGNLSLKVDVVTEDELGELAETFNEMTTALVEMKSRAENANPLTKLPGNNVIHEEIEKRIKGNKKFVSVYSDLDNFKAFNDKYGIGAGDQAIKITAKIMRDSLKLGAPSDFLGHEGGDDFILLTTPEKSDAVTKYICDEFDKKIQELYSPEDKAQGFIMSKDREGNVKQFPIMTVSLAGVTNAERKLSSYAEVTNICAEVKKKAKLLSKTSGKSSFYLDHRTGDEKKEVSAESHGPEPAEGTTTPT